MLRILAGLVLCFALSGCGDDNVTGSEEQPVRGLKTFLIEEVEQSTVRRYPSVLQPASVSTLSFEVSGRLKEISLDVGQRVNKGDTLAEIDTRSLELQVEASEAALAQAESTAKNAAEESKRKAELLEKGVTTKAEADNARTNAETSAAQVVQAERNLETAKENLSKAVLAAPYDGIINSVEVQSFGNVSPGSAIATLYSTNEFESSFSVSFEIVNQLVVGKKVRVRLADNPNIVLPGHVSELGARADTVSSFPVVVRLEETDPSMKAGMAVEVSIEFTVPKGEGFTLPISVLPFEGELDPPENPNDAGTATVYVYDPGTETVNQRQISVAGVRENSIIVVGGLELGERVASAGVSFLRDGQKVKLLADTQ